MSRTVYVNGAYVPEEEATISVFDRGFLFADGVYEVTTVLSGKLVDFGPRSEVLNPPFDDYTDLLLKSVPEMELGWLEKVLATRKMESAGH